MNLALKFSRRFSTKTQSLVNPTKKLHHIEIKSPHSASSNKHTLVVLHGMLGCSKNFRSIIKHPSISKYTKNCILVDLRNHGASKHEPTMTIDEMADDLRELLKSLNIDKPVLLGHSLGGKVCMRYAMKHSVLTKAAIIADILPINYYDQQGLYKVITELEDMLMFLNNLNLNRDINSIKEDIMSYVGILDLANFIFSNIEKQKDGSWRWRCNMDAISKQFKHFINEQIDDEWSFDYEWSVFEGPAHIIVGERSDVTMVEPDHLHTFSRVFSDFEINKHVDIIPDARHWLHFDKPALFINSVSKFLSKLPK